MLSISLKKIIALYSLLCYYIDIKIHTSVTKVNINNSLIIVVITFSISTNFFSSTFRSNLRLFFYFIFFLNKKHYYS